MRLFILLFSLLLLPAFASAEEHVEVARVKLLAQQKFSIWKSPPNLLLI